MSASAASGGQRRSGARRVAIVVAGTVIARAGVWLQLGGEDVDPRGLAVLDRPQTDAERRIGVGLVGRLANGRPDRAGVRLLSDDGDHSAILVPIGRTGTRNSDGSILRRFDRVCLSYGASLGFVSCGDVREFLRGELGGASSSETTDPSDHTPRKAPPTHFYGVVPNAVERVEVTFSGRVPSATGSVKNNFYDVVSTNPEAVNRV